jgi:hypothetical protein
MLERCRGPFIAPKENLAVGVSETQTCPGRGLDMSGQLSEKRLGDPICPVPDLVAEELG